MTQNLEQTAATDVGWGRRSARDVPAATSPNESVGSASERRGGTSTTSRTFPISSS